MSLDPLVAIILLAYFAAVILILIVWLIITLDSNISWPLPKIKNLSVSKTTNDFQSLKEARHSAPRAKQSRTQGPYGLDSYRHRKKQFSAKAGNSRVFARKVPQFEPDAFNSSPRQEPTYADRKEQKNLTNRLIDTEKNPHTKSSLENKFNNDNFRGANAKKQSSSLDVNSFENLFENFAKNKKP